MLHKIVKHETMVAKMALESSITPFTYTDGNDKIVSHPIHKDLDTAQKTLLSMLRNLGFTIAPNNKVTVEADGAEANPINANAPTGSGRGKSRMNLVS